MSKINDQLSTNTYAVCNDSLTTICTGIIEQLQLWNIKIDLVLNKDSHKYTDIPVNLPTYFLTLKAHKIPQSLRNRGCSAECNFANYAITVLCRAAVAPSVRGVASVSGTLIAALARLLSSAQQLCIQTIDELWCKLALLCKVTCNGC
jgi:hypothetical protein